MPNWCWNQTVFYGDNEKQKEIYNKIEKEVKSGWPHIDLFLKELGCSKEELNKEFAVRAHISGITLLEDGALELSYESAWNPINETIDEILKTYQPHIKQVTLAEETGCDVFLNTDVDGKYFNEHYYLDSTIIERNESREERYNDIKHHYSLESVVEELKSFFDFYNFNDKSLTTEQEVEKVIEELSEFEDVYITFGNYF